MARIIPEDEMEIADIKAIVNSVIESMTTKAVDLKYVTTAEELTVREILPKTDIGLTNEYWVTPTLTGNAWANYFVDKQVADRTIIGFYGAKNLSADPKATAIRFSSGKGKTKIVDVIQIEKIYESDMSEGFFDEPIIYVAKSYMTVEVYSKAAVDEPLVLPSFVVEPMGEVTY